MRVIAGKARSLPLKMVSGNNIRPTTDRIKETLFNIIRDNLYDCHFLDLFAGSGAIGIEALSRGSTEAYFVENNREAVACIRDNLAFTKLSGGTIINRDVFTALRELEGKAPFHVIFMDPPYDKELEEQVLRYFINSSLINENTLIIVEASKATGFSYLEELGYQIIKRKEYKTNVHLFLKWTIGNEVKNETCSLSREL